MFCKAKSDFGKWGQNSPQNIPRKKGHTDTQTHRFRDSMKESAKGRFFENNMYVNSIEQKYYHGAEPDVLMDIQLLARAERLKVGS